MSKLFILMVFCFVSLKAYGTPNAFDQKFNELQKDMKIGQVKELLGAPDLRELNDDVETWHFNENGGRRVIFKKGKVLEFGAEEKPLAQVAPIVAPLPSPTLTDLAIGQDCKIDDECKLKNCHFHICSGINNCSVANGKVCANDDQCCSGKCDFQICKKK